MKRIFFLLFISMVAVANTDYRNERFENVPEESRAGHFYLGGSWLRWRLEQQGMQLGANVRASGNNITSDIIKPKFHGTNGYRVFAGYQFADSDWQLEAAFTHVPGKGSVHSVGSIALFNTNFPILTIFTDNGIGFQDVSMGWNVKFNNFALDVSKAICVLDCFTIVPHIGVVAQSINQDVKLEGSGTIEEFNAALSDTLRGAGLQAGCWGNWNMDCGFYMRGHVSVSLAYDVSKNRGSLQGTGQASGTVKYTECSRVSIPGVNTFVGFGYMNDWRKWSFDVHLGWEHTLLIDTNQFSIGNGNNMTLQGLTLGCSIGF